MDLTKVPTESLKKEMAKRNHSTKVTGFEEHVFLYAKNHYKATDDTMRDLRRLMAKYSDTYEEYISDYDVYTNVMDAFMRFVSLYDRVDALKSMARWNDNFCISNQIDKYLGKISAVPIDAAEFDVADKLDIDLTEPRFSCNTCKGGGVIVVPGEDVKRVCQECGGR